VPDYGVGKFVFKPLIALIYKVAKISASVVSRSSSYLFIGDFDTLN
jgi:hypothetical protein